MANITDIVRYVRTILDHNLSNSELENLAEVTTLDIDTIIKDTVEAGAMQLMQMVPLEIADIKSVSEDKEVSVPAPISITLPADFLRFVSCKLSGWRYPVTELTPMGSREHQREFGEFADLKATNNRPMAVLDLMGTSFAGTCLTMYGGNAHTSSRLSYIGMPTIDATSVSIKDRLVNPLCYIIAALVCEVLKDTQKSQYLIQTARSLMTSAEGAEEQIIRTNT